MSRKVTPTVSPEREARSTGSYAMIVADPPWHFRARTALQMTNWTSRRDAEKHYFSIRRDPPRHEGDEPAYLDGRPVEALKAPDLKALIVDAALAGYLTTVEAEDLIQFYGLMHA